MVLGAAARCLVAARSLARLCSAVRPLAGALGAARRLGCELTGGQLLPLCGAQIAARRRDTCSSACCESSALTSECCGSLRGLKMRALVVNGGTSSWHRALIGLCWPQRGIDPQLPPVVMDRTRPQRHRPGQIPGARDAARVQLTSQLPSAFRHASITPLLGHGTVGLSRDRMKPVPTKPSSLARQTTAFGAFKDGKEMRTCSRDMHRCRACICRADAVGREA